MSEEMKLKPCPFCNREVFNHFGDKAIIHKQGCPMLHGITEHIKLLSSYQLENWNTRTKPNELEEAVEKLESFKSRCEFNFRNAPLAGMSPVIVGSCLEEILKLIKVVK